MRQKRPYSELFSSVFSRIRTEYGKIMSISPYSVRIQENTDQNNSEYRHFLSSVGLVGRFHQQDFTAYAIFLQRSS